MGINALEPSIDELMDVSKVFLAATTFRFGCSGSVVIRHSLEPTIVRTNADKDVSVIAGQETVEKFRRRTNVIVRIFAVTVGCVATFILANLHEALFPAASDGIGNA